MESSSKWKGAGRVIEGSNRQFGKEFGRVILL
jgi:hypothetical protein